MVEPEGAEPEPVGAAHRPADRQLPADHQDPEGEGLRPGARGGQRWVSRSSDVARNEHTNEEEVLIFITASASEG